MEEIGENLLIVPAMDDLIFLFVGQYQMVPVKEHIPRLVVHGGIPRQGAVEIKYCALEFHTGSIRVRRLTIPSGDNTVPGERTAFAPILPRSPTRAPNFVTPVSVILP